MVKITLQQMHYFKEVAEAGSFSAASGSIGCSTTAVTKAINAIETALGQRLVLRGNRGVELTAAGAKYLERVQPIVQLAQNAEDEAAALAQPARKEIVISSIPSAAAYLLPKAIKPFAQDGGTVRVLSQNSAQVEESVLSQRSHLGVLSNGNRLLSDELKFTLLTKDYFSLVCSKKFFAHAEGPEALLKDAKDLPIVVPAPGTSINSQAKIFLRSLGLDRIKRRIETDSIPFARGVLEEFPSVCVLPRGIAQALNALGGLNCYTFENLSPEISIGIVTRRAAGVTPEIRALISNIRKHSNVISQAPIL